MTIGTSDGQSYEDEVSHLLGESMAGDVPPLRPSPPLTGPQEPSGNWWMQDPSGKPIDRMPPLRTYPENFGRKLSKIDEPNPTEQTIGGRVRGGEGGTGGGVDRPTYFYPNWKRDVIKNNPQKPTGNIPYKEVPEGEDPPINWEQGPGSSLKGDSRLAADVREGGHQGVYEKDWSPDYEYPIDPHGLVTPRHPEGVEKQVGPEEGSDEAKALNEWTEIRRSKDGKFMGWKVPSKPPLTSGLPTDNKVADLDKKEPARLPKTWSPPLQPALPNSPLGPWQPQKLGDVEINTDHDVKSGAVAGKNNNVVYIDPSIKKEFHPFLAVHEETEKHLMAGGMPYAKAHIIATLAEKHAVEGAGMDWVQYTDAVDPEVAKAEKGKAANPPPDPHVNIEDAIGHHADKAKTLEKADIKIGKEA